MGTVKWVGTRFALIASGASAYCDEIVEVLGELQGQNLALIRTGNGLHWEMTRRLSAPPRALKPPCAYGIARAVYRELLGATPPPSASAGLVWAAVARKLDEIGWDGLRIPVQSLEDDP